MFHNGSEFQCWLCSGCTYRRNCPWLVCAVRKVRPLTRTERVAVTRTRSASHERRPGMSRDRPSAHWSQTDRGRLPEANLPPTEAGEGRRRRIPKKEQQIIQLC